jgi:hypothetical protein
MEAAGELLRPFKSEQLISGAIVEQRAAADAVDFERLPIGSFDHLPFNGHEQAEAELEEQLEEDVPVAAVGLEVLDGGFERLGCMTKKWGFKLLLPRSLRNDLISDNSARR